MSKHNLVWECDEALDADFLERYLVAQIEVLDACIEEVCEDLEEQD